MFPNVALNNNIKRGTIKKIQIAKIKPEKPI